ncbi:MAG: squalene/phytoene synthase family protein [Thermoanaerobaculia bacterium]|nr:squalene/phytoene synthase family protein [Thermoanaerobaculia bacterium]
MADLDDLLVKTSRTFALSIPLLPEPTRREVTIAYLLFRIADTFEDASHWPRSRRVEGLEDLVELLRSGDLDGAEAAAIRWVEQGPSEHEGYVELMGEVPAVLRAFSKLRPAAREIVARHVERTCRGMAEIVERTDDAGVLALRDVADLRRYCYIVAGIVGELLTELFLLDRPSLEAIGPYLQERAATFGEALQLVNILKDSADDAREGRSYLPARVDRLEVFSLARGDLRASSEYVRALQDAGAPRGLVAFTALPVLLARATLDRVEDAGPGAKLSRPEVAEIVQELNLALDEDRHAVPA